MTQSTDELERLIKAATPGPWFTFANGHCVGGTPTDGSASGVAMCSMAARTPEEVHANAALIVAAVNALPELVERVRRLEEALKPFAEARLESWGQRTQGVGDYLTRVWIKTAPNIAFAQARATITKDTP